MNNLELGDPEQTLQASVVNRTKTPMRNLTMPENTLDSSKRDIMVSPTIPQFRLFQAQAMSPRPFSVS